MHVSDPAISVIIPTYNRATLLGKTLAQLTRQRLAADDFEVVVADDGSSDETRQVVESFAGQLRIRYYFQEDQGFRAGTARNAGARLASAPILMFLDCGNLTSPDCLSNHLAIHANGEPAAVVNGCVLGYDPLNPMPGLGELVERLTPEEVHERLRDEPAFQDIRTSLLTPYADDPNRRPLPWQLFWTGNCSLRTEDFWDVGGFDEDFHGWGGEDLELGYRITRHGLPFRLVRGAWVIHTPHDRNLSTDVGSFVTNIGQFHDKYREPAIELGTVLVPALRFWDWADEYCAMERWRHEVCDLDVSQEIAVALGENSLRPSEERTVVVVGAGGFVPDDTPMVVTDFDRDLLDQALDGSRHRGYHALGVRLPLADQSADLVIITSRMAGLWKTWGEQLLGEARRIGRTVHTYRDDAG